MASSTFLLLLSFLSAVLAFQNCGYLGPDFPIPSNYSQSLAVQNATSTLKAWIDEGLVSGTFDNATTSFSVEIFTTPGSLFQHHYSAPNLSPEGQTKVDRNGIYRIGSISKVFTVFLLLIEDGDAHFNDPVTKYVPELEHVPAGNAVDSVDWKTITLGNLASQMAGLGRDYALSDILYILPPNSQQLLTASGLPPLNASDIAPCISNSTRVGTRKEYFDSYKKRHPVFASSSSPAYSNAAFEILRYAIETISGKSYESMLKDDIIKPLKLKGTSFSVPKHSSFGVIPHNATVSGWDKDFGVLGPAGTLYASTADMVRVGQAILTSALLLPAQTHRWMKPITHTASPFASVGAPWEIFRYQLNDTNKVVDLYTKNGGIGLYGSDLTLIPDWGVGIQVFAAGLGKSTASVLIPYWISRVVMPAFEEAAREEAIKTYVGTYAAKSGLNSSLTISTSPTGLGLGVESWISNGTDMFPILEPYLIGGPPSIRLHPSGLDSERDNGERVVGWRAAFETNAEVPAYLQGAPYILPCQTWGGVDTLLYNEISADEFVFTVGRDGKAKSVEPRALRVEFEKK